ncbi:hypothetical protein SpCBS45565_g01786 [Spizellomyces sp. 'palustris']|nr:hypothetical protein SpCBS45565_g01786 [Spizellomyces sp. 'palustris']
MGTRFVSTYRMFIRVNSARKLNWAPELSANLNLGKAWTLNTQKPDVFGRGTDLLPQVFLRMQQANLSPYAFSQKLVDSFCPSPLTQARDGVLFVELDKLYRKEVMSLSEVAATPILRGLAHGDQIVPLHANCCVWGSACINNAKNKRWDPEEKTSLEKTVKEAVKPLLGKFDIVLNLCQSSTKSKHDEIISTHILSQEMRKLNDQQHDDELKADQFYVSHEDFVQFIHAASNITVKLSPECQTFLRSYFSALRRLVGNIPSAADSMLAKMETLIRLACCHAKLCLRDTALIDDGLVSILFVEETMAAAHGISILGFNSLPNDQENLHVLFGPGEQSKKSGQRVPEREDDASIKDHYALMFWASHTMLWLGDGPRLGQRKRLQRR